MAFQEQLTTMYAQNYVHPRIDNLQCHFQTHPQLGLGWEQDELFKILLLQWCQVSIMCFKKKKKNLNFQKMVQQMEKRERIDLQMTK